jgi:carboxymethylenebutenolidase
MGSTIDLKAADGFTLSAYTSGPAGATKGIVVIQEIFGVNAHIRHVANGYAEDGYRVISPAIFDRAEPNIELEYDPKGVERGRGIREKIPLDKTLLDVAAAIAALQSAGKVAIVGHCFGGSLAWFGATRLPGLAATVGYYGGMIAPHVAEKPRCPVMLHFGEKDQGIPMSDVEKIKSAIDPAMVQVFT